MGTDLVPIADYAVMKFGADEFAEIIQDNLAGETVTEFDLPRVKTPSGKGKTWELTTIAGVEARPVIQGIIIAKKKTRAYYPTEYDGGNEPPACSSGDGQTGFGHREATAENPEGDPEAETGPFECASCPLAQWGSGVGNGKACNERMSLFMLPPDALLPIVVDLPPTSLAAARQFFLGLSSEAKSFRSVVTSIALEQAQAASGEPYARAVFSLGGDVDDETRERMSAVSVAISSAFQSYVPTPD